MFEAEAKASRPKPKFWPWGHFGLEDLTSHILTVVVVVIVVVVAVVVVVVVVVVACSVVFCRQRDVEISVRSDWFSSRLSRTVQ